MIRHRSSRRWFTSRLMASAAALGALQRPASGQTPTALGVPTVEIPTPVTVADGLVVERVYDRSSTSPPAWIIDVRNVTDQVSMAPGVTMSFLDAAGNVISENHPFQLLETMPASGLVPYAAEFHEFHLASADWSSVRFSLRGQWPARPLYGDDLLDIHETAEASDGRTWRATGKVTNVSDLTIESVDVTAIIRSHAGEFLGSIWTTIPTPIPPGGSAPFVCDTDDPSGVMYDPFEVADSPSAFAVQLVATPMATVSLAVNPARH